VEGLRGCGEIGVRRVGLNIMCIVELADCQMVMSVL
jgi:hypothetical protein